MRNINQIVFLRFIFIISSQILVFNNIYILGVTPNIYLIFLLIFPLNYNKSFFYLYIFFAGLFLDFFSNSYGVITFSLLISSLLRRYFLTFSFGNFDIGKVRKTTDYIKDTSLYQKITYLFLMYFSHQFVLYLVEVFSFERFYWIIEKTILSTIISIILSYILLLIFLKKNAR